MSSGQLARLLGRKMLFTDVSILSWNHMGTRYAMIYTIMHLSQRLLWELPAQRSVIMTRRDGNPRGACPAHKENDHYTPLSSNSRPGRPHTDHSQHPSSFLGRFSYEDSLDSFSPLIRLSYLISSVICTPVDPPMTSKNRPPQSASIERRKSRRQESSRRRPRATRRSPELAQLPTQ